MKRVVLVLLAAAVLVPVGAWAWVARADGPAATAVVLREDFTVDVEASGTLEAEVYFEVGPPSVRDFWNYNLTWLIPEGSRVSQGDVILRFDGTDLDDRLRDYQAELETTTQEKHKEERNLEIELKQLDLDLIEARGEIERVSVETSVPEELVPRLELIQTRLKEQLARKRASFLGEKIDFQKELVDRKLELLDIKKSRAQLKIDYFNTAKNKFNVAAPSDGVVLYIPKRNGGRWERGESVWMLAKILKVADVATLRVEATVLEMDAAKIEVGQAAEISIDALPGRIIESRVAEIGRIVHEKSVQDPTKVFDVYLPLEGIAADSLRPGMSVRLMVEVERHPDSLTIPLSAVRVDEKGTYVLVITGGKTARRDVTLGIRNRERVMVKDGLAEGESLLLVGGSSA